MVSDLEEAKGGSSEGASGVAGGGAIALLVMLRKLAAWKCSYGTRLNMSRGYFCIGALCLEALLSACNTGIRWRNSQLQWHLRLCSVRGVASTLAFLGFFPEIIACGE